MKTRTIDESGIRIILEGLALNFTTFGGGKGSRFNPIAESLKDAPLQFAAGVDARSVVIYVLHSVGIYLKEED